MVKLSPLVEQQVLLPFVSLITACADRCALLADLGSSCLSVPGLFSWLSFFLAYFRLSILPAESNIFAPVSSTTSLRVFFFRTDFTCNQNSCPCCIFFVFLFFKSEIWFPFQTCSDGSSASYHSHPFLITFLFVLSGGKKNTRKKKLSHISLVVWH